MESCSRLLPHSSPGTSEEFACISTHCMIESIYRGLVHSRRNVHNNVHHIYKQVFSQFSILCSMIRFLQSLVHILSSSNRAILRRPFGRHTTWYGLQRHTVSNRLFGWKCYVPQYSHGNLYQKTEGWNTVLFHSY